MACDNIKNHKKVGFHFLSRIHIFGQRIFGLFRVKEFKGNVDVLVISETKLDDIFPEYQFRIPEFSPLFPKD